MDLTRNVAKFVSSGNSKSLIFLLLSQQKMESISISDQIQFCKQDGASLWCKETLDFTCKL